MLKRGPLWRALLYLPPILLSALLLGSCSTQHVDTYAGHAPELDVVKFFSGRTEAWGIFQKRNGTLARRFHVQVTGTSQAAGQLMLDEHFVYDDGETQQRVWQLTRQPDGHWRGTASDVVGEAVGELSGNALHWRYVLRLPVDGKTYDMQMDDWMYLLDDKTMVNRTSMRKFGVELGQVSLFFRKQSD